MERASTGLTLVGGASGNVGSALLGELRRSGHAARTGYHSAERAERVRAAGEDAVTIDPGRPETAVRDLTGREPTDLATFIGEHRDALT
jgi:uncharacterized protein YbjT (DUF2867 family)